MEVLLPGPEGGREPEIEAAYRAHGMKRHVQAYALVHNGRLKAVLWQNQSDLGLNLSELLNAIKVVVVDDQSLSWSILKGAMNKLATSYATEHVPALVFPASYLAEQNVRFEKKYMMWVMDVQYGRAYIDYMETRIRRSKGLVMIFDWFRKVWNR
jgi:hypothetical protein